MPRFWLGLRLATRRCVATAVLNRREYQIKGSVLSVLGLTVLAGTQCVILAVGGVDPDSEPGAAWVHAGDTLAQVSASSPRGDPTTLATGDTVLLLAFHPECGHCREVAPLWADWTRRADPNVKIAAVTTVPAEEGADFLASFGWFPEVWTIDPESGAANHRSIAMRTPWAFLIGGDGAVLDEAHGLRLERLAAAWPELFEPRDPKP